jgi:hypothetical protein
MDYRYDVGEARQIDLDSEWEMARKRAERERSLAQRVEALERQVQTLTQLLRASSVDGLYSVQLEGN